jgi:hypothetical protein
MSVFTTRFAIFRATKTEGQCRQGGDRSALVSDGGHPSLPPSLPRGPLTFSCLEPHDLLRGDARIRASDVKVLWFLSNRQEVGKGKKDGRKGEEGGREGKRGRQG